MDSWVLVVALAVLAVASGCSMPDGQETETTPSVTPASLPDDFGEDRPPGIVSDGVLDPARLVAAHEQQLANRSFTLHYNRTRWHFDDRVRQHTTVAAIDDAAGHYRVRTVQSSLTGPPETRLLVATPANATLVTTVENQSIRQSVPSTGLASVGLNPTGRDRLERALDAVRIESATESQDGDYRLRGSTTDNASRLIGARDLLRSVSFEARVTGDGLVESYTLRYTFLRGRTLVTVAERVRITAVGETTVDTTLSNETR